MNKRVMQTIIRRNGHLRLEGDETSEELSYALLYLREHTYARCHYRELGMPIETLIPDGTVITVSRHVART